MSLVAVLCIFSSISISFLIRWATDRVQGARDPVRIEYNFISIKIQNVEYIHRAYID